MLKYFFELETDAEGKVLSPTERNNNKLFAGLEISKDQKSMAEQGKYPVIFFNLKNTKGNNYKEIEDKIRDRIIKLFSEYPYLKHYLKLDYLNVAQERKLARYLTGDDEADLYTSLHFLSELLYKHYNEKVILLIDEYDETINDAYVQFGYESEEFKKV